MTNEPLGYMILPTKAAQEWRLIAQHHTPDWEMLDQQEKTAFETPFPVICYAEFVPSPSSLSRYIGAFDSMSKLTVAEIFQLYPDLRLVYEWKPGAPTLDVYHELKFWCFASEGHFMAYRHERSAMMRVGAGARMAHVIMNGKLFQNIRRDKSLNGLFGCVSGYVGDTHITWRCMKWASPFSAWGNWATKHVPGDDLRVVNAVYVLPLTLPDDPAVDIETLRFERVHDLAECLTMMGHLHRTGQVYEELLCYADTKSST